MAICGWSLARSADDVSRVFDAGGEERRVVGDAVALLRAKFANASIKGRAGVQPAWENDSS
jgi:hypothetical protein